MHLDKILATLPFIVAAYPAFWLLSINADTRVAIRVDDAHSNVVSRDIIAPPNLLSLSAVLWSVTAWVLLVLGKDECSPARETAWSTSLRVTSALLIVHIMMGVGKTQHRTYRVSPNGELFRNLKVRVRDEITGKFYNLVTSLWLKIAIYSVILGAAKIYDSVFDARTSSFDGGLPVSLSIAGGAMLSGKAGHYIYNLIPIEEEVHQLRAENRSFAESLDLTIDAKKVLIQQMDNLIKPVRAGRFAQFLVLLVSIFSMLVILVNVYDFCGWKDIPSLADLLIPVVGLLLLSIAGALTAALLG